MGVFHISTQQQPLGHFDLTVQVLMVDQLSHLIHKSPASIRSDASRNPESLPPICRLPGNKRLLWLREDVMKWLASYVQHPNGRRFDEEVAQPTPVAKKRGRPRKVASEAHV